MNSVRSLFFKYLRYPPKYLKLISYANKSLLVKYATIIIGSYVIMLLKFTNSQSRYRTDVIIFVISYDMFYKDFHKREYTCL